jgi:hypothetical protein
MQPTSEGAAKATAPRRLATYTNSLPCTWDQVHQDSVTTLMFSSCFAGSYDLEREPDALNRVLVRSQESSPCLRQTLPRSDVDKHEATLGVTVGLRAFLLMARKSKRDINRPTPTNVSPGFSILARIQSTAPIRHTGHTCKLIT